MTVTPKIWIGCLAAYNNGINHGDWVDCTDIDEVNGAIENILESSPENTDDNPCEEWHICDYEGFGSYEVTRYAVVDDLAKIGAAIEQHGLAFTAYMGCFGATVDEAEEKFTDHYHGEHNSEKSFSMDFFDELYLSQIPEGVRGYIDYESYAHDLFINSYVSKECPDGGVYVFSQH